MSMPDPRVDTPNTPRLLLPTIMVGTMLAPLNSTMIAVALPELQRAFDAPVTSVAWLVTLYLIAMAVGQPIGGRLGDQYGRRRVYLVGLVWFAVASLGCAFAPELPWLIVFRVQQALAGTLIFPTGAALVRMVVPDERRGTAFGMIGLAASVAAASGPPIGGVLVHAFGWSSIFWMNVPLVVLALAMGWRSLPRHRHEFATPQAFDIPGVLLLALAFSALVLAPTALRRGFPALAIGAIVAGGVLGMMFVAWERRATAPVIDMHLFKRRQFAAACGAILLANLVMYTTLLSVPLYLEGVRGEGVRTTGVMLAALSIFAAFLTPLGGRWTDRYGRWMPAVAGAALVFAGTVALATGMHTGWSALLMVALATMGVGLGISGAPVQSASVDAVPEARAGSASGVYSTSRYIGSVVGSIVLAFVFVDEPVAGEPQRLVWLFSVLSVFALAGIAVNARVGDRRRMAIDPGSAGAGSVTPR